MFGKVLVTGGAGYIGSHTAVKLLEAGFEVVIFDNLTNSNRNVVERISQLTGRQLCFVEGDIRDRSALRRVFEEHQIRSVIHFAGLKAVGESEADPSRYYDNNVSGSIALIQAMEIAGVKTLVFSSSATVYGDPGYAQYREDTPLSPVNVYGKTKLIVEGLLQDVKKADPEWRVAILRYFNPVGAHESGLIGESPTGTPNNLMPFIAQVAAGLREKMSVFGNDYATPDGTGLRDYIHVEDLASGHLAALEVLRQEPALVTVNLGSGRPYSVLEVIRAFERVSGKTIPFDVVARRAGDLAEYYAEPTLAKQLLGWEARLGIERMCADAWRWQSRLISST